MECRLTDELIGYDELAEQCKHICADRQSFELTIRELCRQKRCVVATGVNGEKVCERFRKFMFPIRMQFHAFVISIAISFDVN